MYNLFVLNKMHVHCYDNYVTPMVGIFFKSCFIMLIIERGFQHILACSFGHHVGVYKLLIICLSKTTLISHVQNMINLSKNSKGDLLHEGYDYI